MRKLLLFLAIFLISIQLNAQFTGLGGFGNTNNNTNTNNTENDTAAYVPRFTVKQYFRALGHKDTMSIGWMFAGSIILPGTAQIYNKDYWKLPILYLGTGGLIGGGCYYLNQYKLTGVESFKNNSTYFFIGAAAIYWASLLDGAISYKSLKKPLAGRAAIYSALLPGLGQMYIGDYWRLPIYYGGLATSGYFWYYNNLQYVRFRDMYRKSLEGTYSGSMSTDNLKYYRDVYRRYRDYSILATFLIYALQIIDAEVFATMADFDISDDISMKVNVSPTVITPITYPNSYNYTSSSSNAYGLKVNFTF